MIGGKEGGESDPSVSPFRPAFTVGAFRAGRGYVIRPGGVYFP